MDERVVIGEQVIVQVLSGWYWIETQICWRKRKM